MSDDALAFWIVGPGRGEIRRERLPTPAEQDVLVETVCSGISRGTESLVFRGLVPASEHRRMKAPFQSGEFGGAVKYGYCNVGRVERGPEALEGRLVFCLYPHQTRYVVPAAAVHRVPADVPPGRAILAAQLETAINGLWDASPRIGERISVVGAGAVGALVAWLASRIPGCEVELVDIDSRRAALARALGVPFATPERARAEADVVIHASGNASGLQLALQLAAFEATVVDLSWYGSGQVSLPLGEAFHSQRLTLRSSQVGHLPPTQAPRWSTTRRLRLALALLADPALDALIDSECRFDELPDVMPRLASSAGTTIFHRVNYGASTCTP